MDKEKFTIRSMEEIGLRDRQKNGRCIGLICPSCGKETFKGWSKLDRVAMPKCSECGGILDFKPQEIEYTKKDETRRRCQRCGCKLRKGNYEKHCDPCETAILLGKL